MNKKKSWIDKLVQEATAKPPTGAFDIDEFAKRTGYSRSHAQRVLDDAAGRGEIKTGTFRGTRGAKKYYWEKD